MNTTHHERIELKQATYKTDELVCGNCAHFQQHYALHKHNPSGYRAVASGHCFKPRLKRRSPFTEGCVYWEKR